MLISAVTLMQAVVTVPPLIVAPPSPSAPPYLRAIPGAQRATYPVDVEIRGGGALLWSGTISVGGNSPTSLSHRLSQPATDCADNRGGRESGYNLSLYSRSGTDGQAMVQVNASWTHPAGEGCTTGSRMTSFNEEADLSSGRPVVLQGDGGLQVTLRRR